MKILMYTRDEGGIKTYSEYLASAMKKQGFLVKHSDKMDYCNFDIVHIHMDYSQFHPWGMGLIPILIKLKLNKKKVIITIGTILRKNQTYARNKFFTKIKNMVLSISNPLIALLSDKITVMVGEMKTNLVEDFYLNREKIAVIPHGNY